MTEKFNLVGLHKHSEEIPKAEKYLLERKKEGLEKIDGEYDKTKEELKFIDKMNSYISDELRVLGVEGDYEFEQERVHFLSKDVFEKVAGKRNARGVYYDHENAFLVNKDKAMENGRVQLFKTVGHEMLHGASIRKFHADVGKKEINSYRSGYQTTNQSERHHEHFRGLNEGVLDKMLKEIFRKNEKELTKEFEITKEEGRRPVGWYSSNIDILDTIIKKIAQEKGESEEDVWRGFKKGFFTGGMAHLKDVERVFGKGSLRVLAALDSEGSTKDMPVKEVDEAILQYFKSDDEKEKKKLATSILSERERTKYLQQKKKINFDE